jgi:hypothetical protein
MEAYSRTKLLAEVLERFSGFHWILAVAPHGGFGKTEERHPRTGPLHGPFVYKQVDQATEDGRWSRVQSTEQAWFRAAEFDAEGNLLITVQNGRGRAATLVVDAEYLRPEDDNDLADDEVEGLIADHLRYLTAETVIGFTISELNQARLSELEARQLKNTRGD